MEKERRDGKVIEKGGKSWICFSVNRGAKSCQNSRMKDDGENEGRFEK